MIGPKSASVNVLTNTVEKVRNPSHFFKPIEVTNSAVAVEWL